MDKKRQRRVYFDRLEWYQLGMGVAGAVLGQLIGMLAVEHNYVIGSPQLTLIIPAVGSLIIFLSVAIKLFGHATDRAKLDYVKDGIDAIVAGQKENAALLKEIIDILKGGKADGGARTGADG